MRLGNVTSVKFNIEEQWHDHVIARIVSEMNHESQDWYILNESTGVLELDPVLMEAGIKDFIKQGAVKVKAAMQKAGKTGQDAYDTIGAHLAKKLQNDMPEAFGKLKQYVGNHKTAVAIIAVVGASLMAMEPAAASQAMDAISQTPIDQLADSIAGAADTIPKGISGDTILGDVINLAKQQGADQSELSKALHSLQIKGMSADQYAQKVAEVAAKSKNPDGVLAAGKQNIIDALKGTQQAPDTSATSVTQGADAGGKFTTTTKDFTRSSMNPDTARRLRGG